MTGRSPTDTKRDPGSGHARPDAAASGRVSEPAGAPPWSLSAETVAGWIADALGHKRTRFKVPPLPCCYQIGEIVRTCGEPATVWEQLAHDADMRAREERLGPAPSIEQRQRWLKNGRAFADGLDARIPDAERSALNALPGDRESRELLLRQMRLVSENIRAVLEQFKVGHMVVERHRFARELAFHTRLRWKTAVGEAPSSLGHDDPLCKFVAHAMNWIADRRGESRVTCEWVSAALRERDRSRRARLAKSGA